MKEVITINLSGRVLSIEKDAADSLKNYLDSLRNHFNAEEGADEIMADKEFLIAELLGKELNSGKVAISIKDVEEVKAKMGLAEELSEEEAAPYSNATGKRRLSKNTSNKMIGGVCSGVASFFAIDTTIVRIVWAILALSGGLGFLVYIALWIFLPESDEPIYSDKKLFRDTDNAWISGVCAGLAKYMKIDVWIPRLIFGLPVAASILGGIGLSIFSGIPFIGISFNAGLILIYIILSYVIPKALTDFDKMDMEGEAVNLESIKNRFNDQMGETQKMVNAAGIRAKKSLNEIKKHRPIPMFFSILGTFLLVMFVLASAFLVIGIATNYTQLEMLKNWVDISSMQENVFISLASVLVLMILLGITILLTARLRIKGLRKGMVAGWVLGFFVLIGLSMSAVFSTIKQYSKQYSQEEKIEFVIPRGEELLLKDKGELEESAYHRDNFIGNDGFDFNGFDINKDSLTFRNIRCSVYPTKDTFIRVIVLKRARGKNKKEAMQRTKAMEFNYTLDGTTLNIPETSTLYQSQKYGGQYIKVKIYVPKGTKVVDELKNTIVRFRTLEKKSKREWVSDMED